jgi:hypothetical protein
MTRLHIQRVDFLDWYLDTSFGEEFKKDLYETVTQDLYYSGTSTISVNNLFKEVAEHHKLIPLNLVQGFSEEKPSLMIGDLFSNFEIFLI